MRNLISLCLVFLLCSQALSVSFQKNFLKKNRNKLFDDVGLNDQSTGVAQKSFERYSHHSSERSSEKHSDSQNVDISIHFNVGHNADSCPQAASAKPVVAKPVVNPIVNLPAAQNDDDNTDTGFQFALGNGNIEDAINNVVSGITGGDSPVQVAVSGPVGNDSPLQVGGVDLGNLGDLVNSVAGLAGGEEGAGNTAQPQVDIQGPSGLNLGNLGDLMSAATTAAPAAQTANAQPTISLDGVPGLGNLGNLGGIMNAVNVAPTTQTAQPTATNAPASFDLSNLIPTTQAATTQPAVTTQPAATDSAAPVTVPSDALSGLGLPAGAQVQLPPGMSLEDVTKALQDGTGTVVVAPQ